ncbi:MAG: hypothetical protein ACP5U2_15990 [Bryobacteraceae bacterium]
MTHQDVRLEQDACQDAGPDKTCLYEVRFSLTSTEAWEYGQCCRR